MALTLRAAGCRCLLSNSLSSCTLSLSRSLPAFLPLKQPTKQPTRQPTNPCLTHIPNPAKRFSSLTTRAADGEVSVAEVSTPEAPAKSQASETSPVELLDFRVGRVLKAWKHPEADGLFVEEVDVGEEDGPRTIVSGLVGYVPLEEMQDRPVVVFANLKPRNMRGIKSNGMLVAASDAEHTTVELVTPPADAAPGERIWFGGEEDSSQSDPAGANQENECGYGRGCPYGGYPNVNQVTEKTFLVMEIESLKWGQGQDTQVQKKKIWEAVQPKLNTSDGLEARYEERVMRTSAGACTVKSLKGARLA